MPKLPQSILVAGCAIALVGLCTAVLPDGASTTTASTAHPLVFVHGSRLAVRIPVDGILFRRSGRCGYVTASIEVIFVRQDLRRPEILVRITNAGSNRKERR